MTFSHAIPSIQEETFDLQSDYNELVYIIIFLLVLGSSVVRRGTVIGARDRARSADMC